MLISTIIAKVLALTDAFLSYFVTTSAGTAVGIANCGTTLPVYATTMTPCGTAIVGEAVALVAVGLQALAGILGGVMAT